ncbi:MAG: ASKHA domain-containing protein [Desulfomonilaceae bacterium]
MISSPPITLESNESAGKSILDLVSEHGLDIRSDCGGKGTCGKCMVLVHAAENISPITEAERKAISGDDLASGFRLACQSIVFGKTSFSIPDRALETPESSAKTDIKGSFPVCSPVHRLLTGPRSRGLNGERDVLTLLKNAVPSLRDVNHYDLSILCDLSSNWSEASPVTVVKHDTKGLTAILQGHHSASLGFAVDIGTTTVAAYLCDLTTGNVLATSSCSNPQKKFGEDVINRIDFAVKNEDGTRILKDLICSRIDALFKECLAERDASLSDVDEVVVVGNTTMQHLFCAINPGTLGRAPYYPVIRSAGNWAASDVGLSLNPYTNVHVFPVISGFLGGDILGALLWDGFDRNDETTLLVDIGTNGEIVLSNKGDLWATSCATGPAFEGAHISSGIRAVRGAISKIRIDPTNLNVDYELVPGSEGAKPIGICGSGVIDAVAEMRKAEINLPDGRFKQKNRGVSYDSKGIGRSFDLVPAVHTATGLPIAITLRDVREIQLAKAALHAGITLLMASAGVNRIDRLVLTGAFGACFDWKNAFTIGMLPASCVSGKVETVVNAAGLGAVMSLLDSRHRDRVSTLANKIKVVELAEHPDFQDEFTFALDFPLIKS